MGKQIYLVVTCEHAGNRVPKSYAGLFRKHRHLLRTHQAYDPGALELARAIGRHFGVPLFYSSVTRLLVDLNRSVHNPNIFSMVTRSLDRQKRNDLLTRYYHPHRHKVYAGLMQAISQDHLTLHLGVHTFAPELRGTRRDADIGLLYDPRRPREKSLCLRWKKAIEHHDGNLRVRLNYPYRGQSDGLATALRRLFPVRRYLGIELEVNQHLFGKRLRLQKPLRDTLTASLAEVLLG